MYRGDWKEGLSGIVLSVCFLLFQLVVGSWEKVFKVRLRGEEKYLDISPALHSITTIATIIVLECVSRRSFCCRDLSACCTVPRFMLGGVYCPFVLFLPFHCETIWDSDEERVWHEHALPEMLSRPPLAFASDRKGHCRDHAWPLSAPVCDHDSRRQPLKWGLQPKLPFFDKRVKFLLLCLLKKICVCDLSLGGWNVWSAYCLLSYIVL